MKKQHATETMALGCCCAVLFVGIASAQNAPDGATLFEQQCVACHTTNQSDAARMGPTMFKVVGRPAGKVEGFRYSPALAKADFVWDETRLDSFLTNSKEAIPGTTMPYRQANPETRAAIIAYLKELK